MALWRVDVFVDRNDTEPSRKGYILAASEDEAVQKGIAAMGSDFRADLTKVTAKLIAAFPSDRVLWDNV